MCTLHNLETEHTAFLPICGAISKCAEIVMLNNLNILKRIIEYISKIFTIKVFFQSTDDENATAAITCESVKNVEIAKGP